MAVYEWKGVNSGGKNVKGVRDAENAKALRVLLKKEGVLVTEVMEETEARIRNRREIDFKKYFQHVNTMDVAVVTRQLATLLKSGIPLVECLTALIDQLDQPELKSAFTQTRDRVNEGSSLADALGAHPKLFSHLYVNMVAAGEASGTLETVLARLAEFLEAQAKLKSKVTGAVAYPAFMAIMGVAIIFVMMTVVVPKVTAIFEDFNQSLPWYTRLLMSVSNLFTNYWYLLLLLIVGAVYFFRRWKGTTEGQEKWDRFALDAPLFGKLLMMIAVTRFARTLSTLLASGVPVLSAMEITRNVLGNTELMRVVDEARNSVREGESIAEPLRRSGRFPPIVTHMIAIGERSGQLEEMLENIASAYDTQVESRITIMTSLLEPIMIVVMGGISGGIAFAILMPLLQINEFVQ
ncbi:MAG: type II secretion system inner membrane protein GspF [Myxococcales bacterium]|nr:type II secretion system inner membrane protein GspF [Myxococcales bacterium]